MALTILCVEDEADLRQDIAEELIAAGYHVLQAGDGAAALQMLGQTRPDLVLCDITLPRMSGLELLKHVRASRPDLADLPFVFLTALAGPRDLIAGQTAGGRQYLH